MDKVIIRKLTARPNYLKDHNFKYLALQASIPERLGKLREIVESLPNGERKAQGRLIVDSIHADFQEIVKDYEALQEGSQCRNVLEDLAGYVDGKEKECAAMIELNQKLTKRLNDNR